MSFVLVILTSIYCNRVYTKWFRFPLCPATLHYPLERHFDVKIIQLYGI